MTENMETAITHTESYEWCRSHGLTLPAGNLDERPVYACGACHALTIEPYQHADWHIRQERAENGSTPGVDQ